MRRLKNEEMINIEGGADPVLVGTAIGAIVTFIIGILSGYSNPKKCNN